MADSGDYLEASAPMLVTISNPNLQLAVNNVLHMTI
jgi:hypothetical protein